VTDRSDLARKLHVADADVRSVDWVDGECYVTLSDGTVRIVNESGYKIAAGVPSPQEPEELDDHVEIVPDASTQVVIEWVASDRARALQALDDERARARPRKGLLAYLERLIA
jgi:hypothetical protein